MHRLFRLSLLTVLLSFLGIGISFATDIVVSGSISPGEVRVFLKDYTYIITKDVVVGGTLIIEPGTTVKFYPQGRLIDSVGGRIIADGFAKAAYSQYPSGINPIATPYTPANPQGFSGFADLNYLLYQGTIQVTTTKDLTINQAKRAYIDSVVLNKTTRTLENLQTDQIGLPVASGKAMVSFETALMFVAARMETDPNNDINLNIKPWRRLGDKSVNIDTAKIYFKGQPENSLGSREWGHIIILPGARAAFFRNVTFDGFRKDTTVDRVAIYKGNSLPGVDLAAMNNTFRLLTNGAGGAITTFSSRTWILNCTFKSNMARYRGGAIQFLQAPDGYPMDNDVMVQGLAKYPGDKNPNYTDPNGQISSINSAYQRPAIDQIDDPSFSNNKLEPVSDFVRQAYDDGRLSIYLGRFRYNKFDGNYVQLSNVGIRMIGSPPVAVTVDLTDEYAKYPQEYGNQAFGGAIYISGKPGYGGESTQIELGIGVNNSIKNTQGTITFPNEDSFEATNNKTSNYQFSGNTFGARGGAIYLAKYTSLIVAGKYDYNYTYTKYLQDSLTGSNNATFSQGGAIFCENTLGRLQVRGGPKREYLSNPTEFVGNSSGAGGAIFVDGNTDPEKSPVIGGTDVSVATRDYGFNIRFEGNKAMSYGGAIYTKRNLSINGAGGIEASGLLGYGGKYPVRFYSNTAGYAGGAVNVTVPNSAKPLIPANQRAISVIRSEFRSNDVGSNIATSNKPFIRGGGALYIMNADLNVVKGTEFTLNTVQNGNGGAVALVNPENSLKRFFLCDLDNLVYDNNGIAVNFISNDPVMSYRSMDYPPDARMLTRFLDNKITLDADILASQSGSGTTQIGYGSKGTPNQLFGVHFIDQLNGFAVGMNGTIVKMTLGGSKWVYKNYNQPYRLTDVFFTTPNTGFIVGDRGVILKTINTGNDWTEVRPALDNFKLNSVNFSGSLIGYAVGDRGKIFKTSDGGDTWFDPTMANYTNNNLNCVFFTGTNKGYAVGDRGTIIVTANGGVTWDVKTANTFSNFQKVYFTDTDTGYAVGTQGVIFKTTNGGNSWANVYQDPTRNFTSVYFTSLSTGYVVGEFGFMLKTTDAGKTWNNLDPQIKYSFFDVFFPTFTTGYIVGDYGLVKKTTDAGNTWTEVIAADISFTDVRRYHPEAGLPENGIGLGGGLYILDSVTANRSDRRDSVMFNRVRIQNNTAFTGSAIYSDNFDLKLIFSRSLITSNTAESKIGFDQNAISGAVYRDKKDTNTPKKIIANEVSSDLAAATIYGEIQGPLPSWTYGFTANSIYNNNARFEIRLPDAYNTKGILSGTTGIGYGGTDTLRGNYWGRTDADVDLVIGNRKIKAINGTDTVWFDNAVQTTFFVENQFNLKDTTYMRFLWSNNPQTLPKAVNQGPFESRQRFNYRPVTLANKLDNNNVADEKTSCDTCLPEKVVMAGMIYDSYDKGTDIKTADYSQRRLSPIEDFAVGIPPFVRRFNGPNDTLRPSFNKYVRRWIRDPYYVDLKDQNGQFVYPQLQNVQDEFRPYKDGSYYHPIGYPLYLESRVDYSGLAELSNHDPRLLNESVFFIINETTGDFIRANFKQVSDLDSTRETFRATVELVPDSSNRYSNYSIRRSTEGLYNLGIGYTLLSKLVDPLGTIKAVENEDRGTLQGRKYHAGTTQMGKVSNIFSNRPGMPSSNSGNQTFFAGDKYKALPVDTGDVVRIVSRTVLWREGVIPSFDDGISFKIVGSTEPPVWTGNIVHLQMDTIIRIVPSEDPQRRAKGWMDTIKMTEFLNKIFVTEDREYPSTPGTYSGLPVDFGQGRDSILTATAMDTNRFYDPRSLVQPDYYPQLTYRWNVDPSSGVSSWLMVDTIPAGEAVDQNPRDLAYGYFVFRGRPINPYVVPGGEDVFVSAENWPPHMRTADSLKALIPPVAQDVLDRFINIFQPYLNAYRYDLAGTGVQKNARYLQQDTINSGSKYVIRDTFKLFVIDSIPRFLPENMASETIQKRINRKPGDKVDWVVYNPSVYTCGLTSDGKLKANFTNKLRFQADFNTDDESEDSTGGAQGWDFRYGKTAYGFMNINIRNGSSGQDTTVIDTTTYDGNGNGHKDVKIITQTRPVWMGNDYIYEYGSEANKDTYARFFTTNGQLNIRIDSLTAWGLLSPVNPYARAMITDTVFTVVCNDGHAGLNFIAMPVFINYVPIIETTSLPNAVEDFDYNPLLMDSSRMIRVYDPNFGQAHEFMLVYDTTNFPNDKIDKDPCFPEAGQWDLTGLKTTPVWLRINPISGLLFGTPGVHDAPKSEKVTLVVWDLIDGVRQLSAVKVFDLQVDPTNHKPGIQAAPYVRCVDAGKPYQDTIVVSDWDLQRTGTETETLTITVLKPSGLTVTPSTINGPLDPSGTTYKKKIIISSPAFNAPVDPDGKVTIIVVVTDKQGLSDTIIYRLKFSEATDFRCTVTVSNSGGSFQELQFGTAPSATTGDGTDGEAVGTLDYNFCEYEIPQKPPKDVFDARWEIPLTLGTTRDIFPRAKAGVKDIRTYKASFQAGGINGNVSQLYPVTIKWNMKDVPDIGNTTANPTGSSWYINDAVSGGYLFHYNMNTGKGSPINTSDFILTTIGDTAVITILRQTVDAFVIMHDWASDVTPESYTLLETGLRSVSPNPFDKNTTVEFGVKVASNIKIEVVDAIGNTVATIADGDYQNGIYKLDWEAIDQKGTALPSGSYTCRMIAGPVTSIQRMVIVK